MDNASLNLKWDKISASQELKGYKALRISDNSIPDLFIATDKEGFRCLILYLPEHTKVKLKGSNREKLTLEYLKDKNIILIKLNDSDFVGLFDDLIISLYSMIKDIEDPSLYSKGLTQSFYKWAEFFEDRADSKLSNEEIKGLFGELFTLRNLLEKCKLDDFLHIDTILDSWKGPYDTTNDFVFDDKNIEVKTKQESQAFVKISSEHQLAIEFEKGLELLVVSVNIDIINGLSIHDILKKIVEITRQNSGDLSILYRALGQKSLNIENSKNYNNHRFVVKKSHLFNCGENNFPRLSVSNIPKEITKLHYNLRVNSLKEFLIEEKIY
jgi:hypothetical protein